jgi:hypothetical protein
VTGFITYILGWFGFMVFNATFNNISVISWRTQRKPLSDKLYHITKYFTADNSVFPYSNANNMRVTQDLNSFGEMRTVQLMKKMSDASKNIFRVYHIRIIAPQKNGSHDMQQRFLNNHCQECVRTYLSLHDCFIHNLPVKINHNRSLVKVILHQFWVKKCFP